MSDSLWVGVDSVGVDDKTVPSLNVFRKNGNSFELVRIIDGELAVKLYSELTKKEDEDETCTSM